MAAAMQSERSVKSLTGISGFTEEVAGKMKLDCGKYQNPSNRAIES